MAVKILIPTPLRAFTNRQDTVEVQGANVGEVLRGLVAVHPQLQSQLYGPEGKLRSFVNVYLNDEDIRYTGQDATPVRPSDTLSIVPSIAGGAPAPAPELSNDEILRYSRHLIIPEVGMEGQRKLKAARVLTVGAGGLGAPIGLYLAAAGVGTIGIVDFDVVDFTNLQRQVIHSTADVGRPKLDSARESIHGINPNVNVVGYNTRLDSTNALDIFKGYDLVVDGTDNFPTRYLVNDACVLSGIPNVYASIFRFEGQASVLALKDGPCYRCWYPEPPPPGLVPSCAEGGVLGVLPGLMGMIQATEAVKLIMGIGEPLKNRVLLFDALKMKFRELKLRKNPDCPVCGANPTVTQLIDYQEFCGIRGQEAPVAATNAMPEITASELKREMDAGLNPFVLDVREPHEFQIGRIPGSTLIPLGELPKRLAEVDRSRAIVTQCKMGGRSAKALGILREAGFPNVRNLKGGILAWSDEVDPSVPKY